MALKLLEPRPTPVPEPEPPTPRPTRATQLFLRWYGPVALRHMKKHPQLGIRLAKARNPLVPSAYLANVYGHMTVAAAIGGFPLFMYVLLGSALGGVNVRVVIALTVVPVMLVLMSYAWDMVAPDLEISARKKNLESNLPYALNFLAALASQGYQAQVYIPYGRQWLPYFMRRLRERKENVYFLMRNLFSR